MSFAIRRRTNRGAYDQPFSGVRVEDEPLGVPPDRSGLTLHESGFLANAAAHDQRGAAR